MLKPDRKQDSDLRRARLRPGPRAATDVPPRPATLAPEEEWPQRWESMDLSEYDPVMIEIKRAAEAEGRHVWIPKRGEGRLRLPDPVDFGESLSDIVIRNRGREP